jgi:hypothetical protein
LNGVRNVITSSMARHAFGAVVVEDDVDVDMLEDLVRLTDSTGSLRDCRWELR